MFITLVPETRAMRYTRRTLGVAAESVSFVRFHVTGDTMPPCTCSPAFFISLCRSSQLASSRLPSGISSRTRIRTRKAERHANLRWILDRAIKIGRKRGEEKRDWSRKRRKDGSFSRLPGINRSDDESRAISARVRVRAVLRRALTSHNGYARGVPFQRWVYGGCSVGQRNFSV